MAFVKRHFLWILLALILLVEGAVTFTVLGKKADAKTKQQEYEQKEQQVQAYEANPPGRPEVMEILGLRKASVRDELTDCLLFLWHRGEALEQLFPDKRLAEAGVYPWTNTDVVKMGMGRFRLLYNQIYDQELEKLTPLMEKLQITRAALGLAPSNYFTLSDITVGDIYGAQKKFWVVKEIVEQAAAAEITNLVTAQVYRDETEVAGARGPRAAAGPARKGQIATPIRIRLAFRCPYPKVSGFLERLYASPLGFRILAVSSIQRAVGTRAGAPGESPTVPRPSIDYPPATPRPGGAPTGPTPEMGVEGAVAVPRPTPEPEAPAMVPPPEAPRAAALTAEVGRGSEQLTETTLTAEVPDLHVGIQEVSFSKSDFPKKEDVKSWVEGQLAAATAALAQAKAAAEEAAKARTSAEPKWATDALAKLAPKPAEKAGAAPKAEPAEKKGGPLAVLAYPGEPFEREYLLDDPEVDEPWLRNPTVFGALRLEALKDLWEQVLSLLDSDRTRAAEGGITVTLHPGMTREQRGIEVKHFDENQAFDQTLSIQLVPPGAKKPVKKRTVTIKFGLLIYSPAESERGRSLWMGGRP
jgi:hypothetical protein